jgi:hypothetical protein
MEFAFGIRRTFNECDIRTFRGIELNTYPCYMQAVLKTFIEASALIIGTSRHTYKIAGASIRLD